MVFDGWHVVDCFGCGVSMDRDENAVGNIGLRFKDTLDLVVATRRRGKNFTEKVVRRSPMARVSLKYPGRDRSKKTPTLKRPRKRKSTRSLGEVSVLLGGSASGDFVGRTVLADGGAVASASLKTLERRPGILVSTAIYRVYQE